MIAPVALIVLAFVGYAVMYLKKAGFTSLWRKLGWTTGKKRAHGNFHRHSNALIGASILMFQFIYIYCTKTAFEPFACVDKEDGKSYMRFEPKIRCWEGNHLWLAPMGIAFGMFYGIAIPLILTFIVYRNREIIKNDQVLRVLGTGSSRATNPKYYEFRKRYYKLYYRFKPRYHYWGQVILLRKFLVVLCTVFLKSNPTLQATCALMILFVSYSVHIRALPYLRNDLLGAGRADIEKATQNSSAKNRWAHLSRLTKAGSLVNMVTNEEKKQQEIDDAASVRERALTLINKNPKSMSLRSSIRKRSEDVGRLGSQMRRSISRHRTTSTDAGVDKYDVELVSITGRLRKEVEKGNNEESGGGGGDGGNGGGGRGEDNGDTSQEPSRRNSMYGPTQAIEEVEDDGKSNSMAANMKISKKFLSDYNTMETIFHFCSILILLCALMFESGSQGDLRGGGGSKTAKRNAALAAAPTLGDASATDVVVVNEGAEHYLLVIFVIFIVAASSIYFMWALGSEVIRSFLHFARVMKQQKKVKKQEKEQALLQSRKLTCRYDTSNVHSPPSPPQSSVMNVNRPSGNRGNSKRQQTMRRSVKRRAARGSVWCYPHQL